MSSLLELIARRRRASADRRLGPPPRPANGTAELNGHRSEGLAPSSATGNGHAPDPAALPALDWMPLPEDEPAPVEKVANEVEASSEDEQLTTETAAVIEEEPLTTETAAVTEEEPLTTEMAVAPGTPPPLPPTRTTRPRYESWLPPDDLIAPPLSAPAPPPELEPAPAPVPAPAPAEGSEHTSDREPSQPRAAPGFLARARIRRRVRYLQRLRELQLRDIGGFQLELHRFSRRRPDLVRSKLESAAQTDRELRVLERALGEDVGLRELREPGIGGACRACGAVHGSADRFCAACGRRLDPPAEA